MATERHLIRIGRLSYGEPPELVYSPGWDRLAARYQPETGLVPEAQSGLTMTHRIDSGTNVQLNALVDKVNRILSRKTLVMVLIVAAVAFFIGKTFFGKKPRRKKQKRLTG